MRGAAAQAMRPAGAGQAQAVPHRPRNDQHAIVENMVFYIFSVTKSIVLFAARRPALVDDHSREAGGREVCALSGVPDTGTIEVPRGFTIIMTLPGLHHFHRGHRSGPLALLDGGGT